MRRNEIKVPIMIPIIIALAILLGGGVVFAYLYDRAQFRKETERYIAEIDRFLAAHMEDDIEMLNIAHVFISQNRQIHDALKAGDREALLEQSAPLFNRLRNENEITHFYFTGTDRVNLLRVHKPDRYGDVIDRYVTLEAERTGKPTQGIELGPLGTFTLRVVHPWFDGERLIGFVELGHEINHIINLIHRTHDVQICVIIRKEFLNREDWQAGMKMLGRTWEWDRFPDSVASSGDSREIPKEFIDLLSDVGIQGMSHEVDIASGNRDYRICFLPLIDAGGSDVGWLAVILDITDRLSASMRFVLTVSLVSIVVGGILATFFLVYLGRIEKTLGNRME